MTAKIQNSMRRNLPYVFSEQGIAMLASVLRTSKAAEVSVRIMDAFVIMRKFIIENMSMYKEINSLKNILLEHDDKINELFDKFDKRKEFKSKIFFEGEIYDAYGLLIDIIKEAKSRIIIIDNYIDKTILDVLSKKEIDCDVLIITNQNCKLSELDISKFNEQYPKLSIKYSNNYHDRFIIIDETIFHCGASLKDLGKKCFAITKMEDKSLLSILKNY